MRFSTVAVVSAVVLAVFASSVCEARGGRAFGGRSFSRSAVTVKAPASRAKAPVATTTTPAPAAAPVTRRDDDSFRGGFWSSFFGGAAGSAAGVMIGNSLTSGDEKKPEQKE